ncbi:MAG TPA: HEAT repeat domain-containing protein, partial [Polyangiaceae bacterium]|nr:HEAT repeat domain-containing protein [Polyangiaceae bacterium]
DKSDKSKDPAESKPAVKLDSSKLHSQLRSGDEEQMLEALTAIAENRGTDLAPLVSDVLNRGSTVKVLTLAIDTASRIKAPALSESLAPYVRHRDSDLRRAALRALLKTQGPAAAKALRQALHSQDAYIRGTAASGLGSLGATDAVDDLFAALASNVGEAAASIGQLCNAAQCEKLASLLGKTPFDIITGGLEQALFRPANQVPDASKVKIVVRLRELGTAEARRYLSDVRSRWPEDGSPAVRQALESSVKGQVGVAK